MGLLERIVRRRRASASRRLGPPASDSSAEGEKRTGANGTASADFVQQMRDTAPSAATTEPGLAVADEAAVEAGTEPAAGLEPEQLPSEPPSAPADGKPNLRERGRIRRRVRYLRRLREVQLRDIGGFVVELERFGREQPELVRAKIESAARTDAELRALEVLLDEEYPLRELREPGIGGACPVCGAVHGSEDRFCASCGEQLREEEPVEEIDPLVYGHVYPE
jgi:hypothetical protein